MGMQKKDVTPTTLTEQELQLIQQLRRHPNLLERFHAILEITRHDHGPLKKADEVEALLIEEMRRLGNTTLGKLGRPGRETFGPGTPANLVTIELDYDL